MWSRASTSWQTQPARKHRIRTIVADRPVAAVQAAIQSGANINYVERGFTSLMWASQEGHATVVDELLEANAYVNYCDIEGMTALRQAVSWSHIVITEQLIRHGANVNQRDKTHDTVCTSLRRTGRFQKSSFSFKMAQTNLLSTTKGRHHTILRSLTKRKLLPQYSTSVSGITHKDSTSRVRNESTE